MDNKAKRWKYRLECQREAADSLGVSLSAIRRRVSAEKGSTGAEQANPGVSEGEE
ncbi:hypothetical protein [Candidatus Williamhamiltonella defendens]|uniref:hypothetical protein n=1 Tax=Candidatus Williamhamiltonella defendens TaxID=138072 RepID=UPI0002E10960|nr:hypothetical protein [Candidatus Hamiltonella defensa]